MKRTAVMLAASLLFSGLVGKSLCAGDGLAAGASAASTDYAAAVEKLNGAVPYDVAAKQLPAFSIALVDDQRIVWAEGFGYQDAEEEVPATAATVYRVGSISTHPRALPYWTSCTTDTEFPPAPLGVAPPQAVFARSLVTVPHQIANPVSTPPSFTVRGWTTRVSPTISMGATKAW